MSIKTNIPFFFSTLVCLSFFPPSLYALNELNDTGITWGGNYPQGNNAKCEGSIVNNTREEPKKTKATIIDGQDCK